MSKYRGYINILGLLVVFVFRFFFFLKTQAQWVIPGGNVSSDCLLFDSTPSVLFAWLAAGSLGRCFRNSGRLNFFSDTTSAFAVRIAQLTTTGE